MTVSSPVTNIRLTSVPNSLPKSEKKPLNVQGKAVAKTSIKYAAPAGRPLDPVTRRMTIVASVSPDDGYPVLTEFLAGVQTRLTAAMYDFTSADILKAVEKAIKPDARPFEMVIDHPPRNPTANQSDEETRAALVAVDSHGEVNWALTRNDPQASEWIYPTAYHIKVAVRDGAAFWLSSGNWNVSNQPNFAAKDPKRGNEPTADRDWHVVVMDPELAALYEAYIRNDFQVAAPHQNAGNPATLTTIQAALKKYSVAQKRSSPGRGSQRASNNSHVPHKIFENVPVTVQPLLTPDPGTHTTLYVDRVLALIKSAKKSIYMQTQYIHPSDKPADKDFMLLVDAMATAHKSGLDVRVITSQFENTPQWVETLVQHDLVDVLRIQQAVHNKGIVVDSATVMISSENWSADGTLRNRDAGVIIKNADIAHYFERVFLDDWVNRASKKLKDPSPPAPVAKKP